MTALAKLIRKHAGILDQALRDEHGDGVATVVEGQYARVRKTGQPGATADFLVMPGINVQPNDRVFWFQRGQLKLIRGVLNRNAFTASGQLWFSVLDFGAVGDGRDDFAAFQAAIDAAAAAGGGRVYVPPGTFGISGTLLIEHDGVKLVGDGIYSTFLVRVGSSTEPIIWLRTPDLQQHKVLGAAVAEMSIDGAHVAQYNLRVTSVNNCDIGPLRLVHAGAVAGTPGADWQMYMDCWDTRPVGGDERNNQHNDIHDIIVHPIGTPGGIRLEGNTASDGTAANTSLNVFRNIYALIRDGDAFFVGFADGNLIEHLRVYRAPGFTGRGLVFAGGDDAAVRSAHDNVGVNIQVQSPGIHALATGYDFPSTGNIVIQNTGNTGGAAPTIESGATLGYISQGSADGMHFGGSDVTLDTTLLLGTGGQKIAFGSGTPEGVVTAPIGSLFLRSDGGAGTALYSKESGSGNTGWAGK